MKVKMYIDLPNEYLMDEKMITAQGENNTWKKMDDHTRYLIEVDLPIKHFRHQADRKVEAVLVGKEEE